MRRTSQLGDTGLSIVRARDFGYCIIPRSSWWSDLSRCISRRSPVHEQRAPGDRCQQCPKDALDQVNRCAVTRAQKTTNLVGVIRA